MYWELAAPLPPTYRLQLKMSRGCRDDEWIFVQWDCHVAGREKEKGKGRTEIGRKGKGRMSENMSEQAVGRYSVPLPLHSTVTSRNT